ncbi:hypothetical protein MP228_006742 [Amoeboaphelidium protococcarum]|nr:hypothetical protein MP228_006742 [Amoeboaphelidium protococcarum]
MSGKYNRTMYPAANSKLVNRGDSALSSGSNSNNNNNFDARYEQERQNDAEISLLENKVNALKAVTIKISDEVQDQNRFLGGMSTDFDRTRGVLGNTMNRLSRLMQTQNSKYTLYMIIFVMVIFFIAYLASKSKRSSSSQ